ncbi:kinase-like domain-containing protein [Mycena maculata]|uniref:non-specific serine/threonine protein kinase n=1 Tax=Mycena maculata TaxID=230809 RepID=A0AAD7K8A9_9AGAR|nr:kinase-like domain-containing protein [Mycena maculata]
MTNAPPGSSSSLGNSNGALKHTWSDDGESNRDYKRLRAKERDREPRDWRDVHLNRRGGGGRGGGRRRGGDGRRDRFPPDRDRVRKDRDRERDSRDRNRMKDKNRDGDRHKGRSPRKCTPPLCETEEGEISPHPRSVSFTTPPPETPATALEPTPMNVDTECELDLLPSPPPVEQTLAERRARRAAILARHATSASNSNSGSTGPSGSFPASEVPAPEHQTQTHNGQAGPSMPAKQPSRRSSSPPQEQEQQQFTLAKPDSRSKPSAAQRTQSEVQVNAADYDPSLDRREDEFRRQGQGALPLVLAEPADDEEEEEDEVDDMFTFSGPKTKKKTGKVSAAKEKEKVPQPLQRHALHSDTAADAEGYYTVILGEVLLAPPISAGEQGERYQVYASVGKGMFAVVVRARVLSEGEDGKEGKEGGREVAIKIVRAQEVMHHAGLKESAILTKLQLADPEDKKHIVRLERTFEHRGHLCLVFESMRWHESPRRRQTVRKGVGLNIRAVRAYAHQLFIALGHLRKLGVMHADIKPDNILVNDAKTMLKLCDLGSASDAAENEITPYLVSRFYRAPEIILGVPYDPALDIWSIGCTLYELYTGKILFPGRSNNQMLLHMMELKGRFNGKMIKRAKFGEVYFDEMGGFESVEKERASGNDVIRKVHISKPTRDLRARLIPSGGATRLGDETIVLLHFVDLLDRCLALDPARRITPREALAHPFIRGATK